MTVEGETLPAARSAESRTGHDAAPTIRPPHLAAGAVALLAAGLLLLTGVGAWELVRFVAYELAFAVLPGVLALLALTRRWDGWLSTLVLGWALGYALELAAFAATAACGSPFRPPRKRSRASSLRRRSRLSRGRG